MPGGVLNIVEKSMGWPGGGRKGYWQVNGLLEVGRVGGSDMWPGSWDPSGGWSGAEYSLPRTEEEWWGLRERLWGYFGVINVVDSLK